jgi:hypothetical protein
VRTDVDARRFFPVFAAITFVGAYECRHGVAPFFFSGAGTLAPYPSKLKFVCLFNSQEAPADKDKSLRNIIEMPRTLLTLMQLIEAIKSERPIPGEAAKRDSTDSRRRVVVKQ